LTSSKIKYIEKGGFYNKDLRNRRYVVALRFELEENEDSQYPLEDLLDKYCLNCTDHIEFDDGANVLEVEIEDGNDSGFESLEAVKQIAALVGKRVYNVDDGKCLKTAIENDTGKIAQLTGGEFFVNIPDGC